MKALRGLTTAVRTLTTLRVPGADAERLGDALPWFPVAGAVVGGVVWGIGALATEFGRSHWPEGTALAMLGAYVLVTGGLHLDGVADCADALGARGNRERALAIMKDSHKGAFGVIGLVLVLLARWAAYARLADTHALQWVLAAGVFSRVVQVHLMRRQAYARAEGTAGAFVQEAAEWHLHAATGAGLVLVLAACGWEPGVAVAGGVAWAVAWGWGWWCRGRFGGVTGDLIGAGSELAEVAMLGAVVWRL